MTVTRPNHAVLYVSDADRSADFYTEVLGFRRLNTMPGAVFMQAPGSSNDHDLRAVFHRSERRALPSRSSNRRPLSPCVGSRYPRRARAAGPGADRKRALVGASDHGTTRALYAKDPDGLEFELSWLVPAALIDDGAVEGRKSVSPLDIGREKAHYGADTLGGVGVSHAVASAPS